MKDIDKILIKIAVCLVMAFKIVLALLPLLFIVLLFNSCKSHKDIVKTQTDSTSTEVVQIESHTTDNSTTQEDYTEVTYVLDSVQEFSIINFDGGKLNYGYDKIKVKAIKVKNSHVTKENDIYNKIYATEEKTAEIKEKSTNFAKTKPNTTRNLRLVAVVFISMVVILALWRFYRKLD